jgi:hypothetical protein
MTHPQRASGASLISPAPLRAPSAPSLTGQGACFEVDRLWGEGAGEVWARLTLSVTRGGSSARATPEGEVSLLVESAWRGTPPPPVPLGPTWALWEREAVECFIGGAGEEYLELELGPQGHHLGLTLKGIRRATRWFLPIRYTARRDLARAGSPWEVGERWWGEARLSAALLPQPLVDPEGRLGYKVYACACWGPPEARRYATSCDLGDGAPDFHRPQRAPWVPL